MSDSHGRVAPQVIDFFKDVDIILHAGDIGGKDVLNNFFWNRTGKIAYDTYRRLS